MGILGVSGNLERFYIQGAVIYYGMRAVFVSPRPRLTCSLFCPRERTANAPRETVFFNKSTGFTSHHPPICRFQTLHTSRQKEGEGWVLPHSRTLETCTLGRGQSIAWGSRSSSSSKRRDRMWRNNGKGRRRHNTTIIMLSTRQHLSAEREQQWEFTTRLCQTRAEKE